MDQALASNPIFSVGTKAARGRLLEEAELRTYGAGEMVLSEGEAATQLWVLLTGAVRVYHATPEGEEDLGAGRPRPGGPRAGRRGARGTCCS